MQFLWNNRLNNAIFNGSTPISGFGTKNLVDYHLSSSCKYSGSGKELVIDMLSPISMNMLAFAMKGTGASFTLLGNTTNVWTSPAYTKIIYTSDYFHEPFTLGDYGWWIINDLTISYRYYKLVFDNIADPDIGFMFLGQSDDVLQLPPISPSIPLKYNTNSTISYSLSGQTYGNQGINFFESEFEFPIIQDSPVEINGKTIATREDILEFWYVNQGAYPVPMLIFEKSLDYIPPMMAVINQNSLTFTMDRTQTYSSLKFAIKETK